MRKEDDAFDWDENKRLANQEKHEIDFRDAVVIFDKPVVDMPSAQSNEDRRKALGWCDNILIAVICPDRDSKRRIISARPAGKDERALYHTYHPARGSPAAGRD